jgi:putative endopeptidase
MRTTTRRATKSYNLEADEAVNYGAIGAVIGHEVGHGFDDKGSTFDGDGKLRNWWTDEDRAEFEQRTGQLVSQYDSYKPFDDLAVNGEFTLGENIGDLGGISIGLLAYQMSLDGEEAPVIDGFTGVQRVFLGYGQVWRNKYRDEALRQLIATDPHSPSMYRANGAVRNGPEFYDAFDVQEGAALYLAPEERVKIWEMSSLWERSVGALWEGLPGPTEVAARSRSHMAATKSSYDPPLLSGR